MKKLISIVLIVCTIVFMFDSLSFFAYADDISNTIETIENTEEQTENSIETEEPTQDATEYIPETREIEATEKQEKKVIANTSTNVSVPMIYKFESGRTNYIKMYWGKIEGATKYRVYRKTSSSWKILGNTSNSYFIDTKVSNVCSYIYTVRCINANGKIINDYNHSGFKWTYY